MTDLNAALVRSWLPERPADGHKGTFGRVLAVAGSVSFTGAPVLAARAATRSGVGLVFLGVPRAVWPVAAVKCDEAMPFPLPEDGEGRLSLEALEPLLARLAGCDAALLGPGLGQSGDLRALVRALLSRMPCPLVLDADGINALDGHIDVLSDCPAPLVLTPHDGEYRRLMGRWPGEDRAAAAREAAAACRAVVVLKGHRTVIAAPDERLWRNTTGNHGMAKGGSGDALAGILLALLGQGMEPGRAAAAAVWIHGRAGDRCAGRLGYRGMLPTDLIETLPEVWRDDLNS